MFSFTKKSFSFKVYITGNREFLPRKPQICLIHSSKLQNKFSVSHCEIQKPQCGIYISQCGIQILHCETENISRRSRKYARRYKRIYSCFLKDVTWIAKESIECSFYISFNKCQAGNLVFAG